jgi:omega-6 fatty acid desaturase (delta-12 desaturase)
MNQSAQRAESAEPFPGPFGAGAVALRLSRDLASFRADTRRSLLQLLVTGLLFLGLLAVMVWSVEKAYWLTLLISVPAAGLLVRLFIFQHDCGHGAYFRTRSANDRVGRVLSVFTLTPYEDWKRSHAVHHATNGNLDRRGRGDITTLTVREYGRLSPMKKLGYRLYRNPLISVGLGAPLTFILFNRLPFAGPVRDAVAKRSRMGLNVALAGLCGLSIVTVGLGHGLAVYLPVIVQASWIGGWLFYVQHQFEGTYWKTDAEWNFHEAALSGSSYFQLPGVLRWFSGNIGLHHVHHLCSRIPNYHLPAVERTHPEFRHFGRRVTLLESFRCWKFALWDEECGTLVGFRDRHRLPSPSPVRQMKSPHLTAET